MKFRCSVTVPKTNRKCKCKSQFLQYKLCYIHARTIFTNPSVIIQRYWRMYKTRTKFLKITELPSDLQSHIHHFIHRDKNLVNTINKIITNRFNFSDKIKVNWRSPLTALEYGQIRALSAMDIAYKYRTILNQYNENKYNHIYSTFTNDDYLTLFYTYNAYQYRIHKT